MSLWSNVKGFIRAFQSGAGTNPNLKPSSSLARTIEESTHVRGGGPGGGGGLSRGSTEAQHKIVAEGHDNYEKSFKKDS